MVEKVDDKVGFLLMRWCASERDAWFFLKKKHGLVNPNACHDAQSFPSSLWFTWSNFQSGDCRVIKILDRVMLTGDGGFFFQSLSLIDPLVFSSLGNTISDHLPIIFKVFSLGLQPTNFHS